MFPISDENERGHGPAFVSLAIIALNIFVFIGLQGAGGSQEGAEFTYGYSAVPAEITTGREAVIGTQRRSSGSPATTASFGSEAR